MKNNAFNALNILFTSENVIPMDLCHLQCYNTGVDVTYQKLGLILSNLCTYTTFPCIAWYKIKESYLKLYQQSLLFIKLTYLMMLWSWHLLKVHHSNWNFFIKTTWNNSSPYFRNVPPYKWLTVFNLYSKFYIIFLYSRYFI